MPRTAPPPYAGELCRNASDGEEHDLDISRVGAYYGLCGCCRPKEALRRRERRAARGGAPVPAQPRARVGTRDLDGLREEIIARSSQRRTLKATIQSLAAAGDRLQQALDARDAADIHARVCVAEFKEALVAVGRSAQSLVNTRNGNGHH